MSIPKSYNSLVLFWLVVGLVMVYLQIAIGGITRLTGSGLSITEWEIVTGTFPPMTESSWLEEFEKYKRTPQYNKINLDMQMGSVLSPGTFKFIYFWEYLHRLWARLMGFVFIVPFIIFYYNKMIPSRLFKHLGLVILLAVLAATFGWIMVASGLINRPWVNAYKLSLHLCIGISVFIALWWAFLSYFYSERIKNTGPPTYVKFMLILLIVQIFLGGVMSGTKAALFINTWPDYNGSLIPSVISSINNWTYQNFNEYERSSFLVSLIQFLHRNMAYLIVVFAAYIFLRKEDWKTKLEIQNSYRVFLALLMLQVLVGVFTLINSVSSIPVFLGVLHQALAVLTLACFILVFFYFNYLETSEIHTKSQ